MSTRHSKSEFQRASRAGTELGIAWIGVFPCGAAVLSPIPSYETAQDLENARGKDFQRHKKISVNVNNAKQLMEFALFFKFQTF